LGETLGPVVTVSLGSVEYAVDGFKRLVNVEENQSLTDPCGLGAAGVLSVLSLRRSLEDVLLSDAEEGETEREERTTSRVRWRKDGPNSLKYQHPCFVAAST
jgi:hypothetical protein